MDKDNFKSYFENENVRIVGTLENPFFVVKDICDMLELSNVTNAIRNITDKWKSVNIIKTKSGNLFPKYKNDWLFLILFLLYLYLLLSCLYIMHVLTVYTLIF